MFIKAIKKLILTGLLFIPLFVTPAIAGAKNANHPAKAKVTGKINLNKANAAQLSSLKGIGSKKAKAIVDYRKKHGAFTEIKELLKVRGIGPSMLAKISPHLTI